MNRALAPEVNVRGWKDALGESSALGSDRIRKRSTCELTVREVNDAENLNAVHRLVYAAYLGRGYCQPQAARSMALYPHLDGIEETTVLGVFSLSRLVGTVSVTRDGPCGLNVDGAFNNECNAIREEGRVLAATWRMASTREEGYGREVVMAMIRANVRYWLDTGIQTCVVALNPRHRLIYQRLLNMREVAKKDCLDDLSNAPAVLMRWDIEQHPKKFCC